eukprot:NODE_3396_length_401_cov_617.275568_g2587_i1.p1 GENE.NODE_3396_length_401_cov_617.275568_g2587_i1~~NODE_3396_length_401_cov_617.275568_g2587_i1.p1  ORF type:complete len:76 (+),score=3.47 NODE_3396_length_401_cov_617.275568_g2587_i1:96-323(+)
MAKGARGAFLTPVITPEYAVSQIMKAILYEEKVSTFPFMCNTVKLLRLMPVEWQPRLLTLTGIMSGMDHHHGHSK